MTDKQKRAALLNWARILMNRAVDKDANPETLVADARGDLQRMREDWEQAARRQGGAR